MSMEIGAEYASSLADLTVNSKPLINMLTILAEENQEHAGVIVSAVENHLEKVRPEIKLPVLYLVDSIIKNVGGAYTQKFSHIIVNMFTKTFKQVDEKTRSQMFKLRETWNEVFPASKLYHLDVKVNLVDPAWPIQAQIPLNSSTPAAAVAPVIHLNPHFQKKGSAAAATVPSATVAASASSGLPVESKEDMEIVLARKQQELLLLQQKTMQLRQLAPQKKQSVKVGAEVPAALLPTPLVVHPPAKLPIQQRLGPPVLPRTSSAGGARIAPVSGALLAGARRIDPRLARHHTHPPQPPSAPVAPDVFDIKPLERSERITKRKNVITIDVRPELAGKSAESRPRDPRARRDPRLNKKRPRDIVRRDDEPTERIVEPKPYDTEPKPHGRKSSSVSPKMVQSTFPVVDPKVVNKLPPIPRISRPKVVTPTKIDDDAAEVTSPTKRKKESPNSPRILKKARKKDGKDSSGSSPEKSAKNGPRESKRSQREVRPTLVTEEPECEQLEPEQEQLEPERDRREPERDRSEPERDRREPEQDRREQERDRREPERDRREPERDRREPERNRRESDQDRREPDQDRREPEQDRREPEQDRREPEIEPLETELPPATRTEEEEEDEEAVAFKELKNSTRERNYMRRNREKSESPERVPAESPASPPAADRAPVEAEAPTVPEVLMDENKDVDLRVFTTAAAEPPAAPAALVARKRPSTETDTKPTKRNKMEKFDILFGDEDVDLRKLPQMEEVPPPVTQNENVDTEEPTELASSPTSSPKEKCWAKKKDPKVQSPEETRSKLDLVRAKLAEATKGKDRLGRPLLYIKDDTSGSGRRRTISSSEDTDMRYSGSDMESENDRESIKIIMSQAEEQLKGGKLNAEQFNLLVMQVLQLSERQKLKEAKQRESLEASKRKLQKLSTLNSEDETDTPKKANSVGRDTASSFGDIDERVLPQLRHRGTPESVELGPLNIHTNQNNVIPGAMDSDLRVPPIGPFPDGPNMPNMLYQPSRPILPLPPMFRGNFQPTWNGPRPRGDDFNGPRGMRNCGPVPYFRNRPPFVRERPPFEPRMPPPPVLGMWQGECPAGLYMRSCSPPPLGTTDIEVPPTDYALIDYINRDPMKSIDIDGIPREIRFYGRTAIVMLNWDDPREITFLPGRRRITFDGKDTFVLNFNEEDVKANVEGQLLKVGYGKPTRELYVEDRWYECFFGGPPIGILVNGKVVGVHLAGPPPQVDIGKQKKTDIVAGKINVIVDAVSMWPVFLDAKPQKFEIEGQALTIRFVDSLQTVLINEKPFEVEYGGLPKPIIFNNKKHFIRFSVLPKNVRPGQVAIANMEGRQPKFTASLQLPANPMREEDPAQGQENNVDLNVEAENSNPAGGLDMLASLMPSSMAPASQFSGYSVAEPLKPSNPGQIPGLDTPSEENAPTTTGLPFFGSINVNDLFAKLVATGIVQPGQKTEPSKPEEKKSETPKPVTPEKPHRHEKRFTRVDLLKPETLRVKQSGVVGLLYSGMQCSGCGARFPPEQTVRYSQHLDWHFRQNRRERDSARRAHSRNWHYDLSDWIQYEEIEDLEEREKSWFESQGSGGEPGEGGPDVGASAGAEHEGMSVAAGAPADAACALCGDKFDQFYNQDKEEWHLRKAVRHEDKNYHPLCFEDYKASLAKEEPRVDDSVMEVAVDGESKPEAAAAGTEDELDVRDPDVEEVIASDNESVVEVIEMESQSDVLSQEGEAVEAVEAPVSVEEEEEGEDDDVVLKAEPVEQVDVQDDSDTDDETSAARARRDHLYNLATITIKQEPADPDDEPVVTAEREGDRVHAHVDTTHAAVTSSIDGNFQLDSGATLAPLALPAGGIRINITKPHQPAFIAPSSPPSEDSHITDDYGDEPLPPGEEPEMQYTLKPTIEHVEFSRQPPVQRGTELSGLCSIM